MDQDCNGIADSWEAQFLDGANSVLQQCGRPAISNFTGSEDIEPGAPNADGSINCQGNFGDGLTIQDEYRGIHSLARNPDSGQWNLQWASTDPVGAQDAFYLADWSWPNGGRLFAESIGGPGAVLARETPFIQYHRVQDAIGGNPGYAGSPGASGSRGRVNVNSTGIANRAYALEYVDAESLPVGTKGCTSRSGGELGHTQFNNNGLTPLCIYKNSLFAAGAVALRLSPAGLVALEDTVAAHETGHKFSLPHPLRANCCSIIPVDPLNNGRSIYDIGLASFTLDALNTYLIYTRLTHYNSLIPVDSVADRVDNLSVFPEDLQATIASVTPLFRRIQPLYDIDVTDAYEVLFNKPVPIPTLNISINNQLRAIMDWTPRITMLRSGGPYPSADPRVNWLFTQTDAQKICVQPYCSAGLK